MKEAGTLFTVVYHRPTEVLTYHFMTLNLIWRSGSITLEQGCTIQGTCAKCDTP